MAAHVEIYTATHCSYCTMAKQFLDRKNIVYREINVNDDSKKREKMIAMTGRRAVPQIVINNKPIGGYTDLLEIAKSKQLDHLIANV